MKNQVTITIAGSIESGKSTALHLIGQALKDAGLNVKCMEELQEVTPRGDTMNKDNPVDDRLFVVLA